MPLYCYVKDGRIAGGPRTLPLQWYGWDLSALSEAERVGLGWLPSNAISGVRCFAPQVFPDRVEYSIDLVGLRRVQRGVIEQGFAADEVRDFVSSALGEPHAYGVRDLTQRVDLLGSGLIGRQIGYSCLRLSNGVKASYQHSAAQMQQVLDEASAWREALIARLNERLAAIESAGSAAEVLAVVWR